MDTSSKSSGVVRSDPYPELTTAAFLAGYFPGAVIVVSIGYAALILIMSSDYNGMQT